ncbi:MULTISPECIES: sigma-54 interaction domain-containing protein [unclassified Cytobacillus]|uniref:sigma-54 interaction domain-containing protein n=1 Tax=unclassified Cytobacillus TaxID=2675268 RepID=UPI00203E00E7|nr:sigma 54-interacting transcriptional regulator [Cytobacillus sp. AMY 15.2]MCM3090702.1 sigma 54-interacting transcriptional regulator [Cytobacillus sp. AMY 15.2]
MGSADMHSEDRQMFDELEKLRIINENLKSIIHFSSDGLFVVDRNGVVLEANKSYEDMTGIAREEVVGKNIKDLVLNEYFDRSAALMAMESKKKTTIIQLIKKQKYFVVTANPILDKDQEVKMIVTSVRDVTYLHHLQKQLRQAQQLNESHADKLTASNEEEQASLIYASPPMHKLYEKIKQVAPFPTNILITGPSGTGKEVLAGMIHQLSSSDKKTFIKVNCGAIPAELFESEMFGYASGSFTGARREGKPGFFEQANNGTILLDEIGDIPLPLQVKLLRVLQEKTVTRIGDTKPRELSFRLICSTNQDLRQLVLEKKFRQDLWYRINVIHLEIPPLSERREDISPLVEHFLSEFCLQYKIQKQIQPEVVEILTKYAWPGNVRELRNVMEFLIVSTTSLFITPNDLPENIKENWDFAHPFNTVESEADLTQREPEPKNLKESLDEYERNRIIAALDNSKSIRSAAAQLGVNHANLIRKMKRLGIKKDDMTGARN